MVDDDVNDVIAELVQNVHSDDESVRAAATRKLANELGRAGTQALIPLLPLVDDHNPTVRQTARNAIAIQWARRSVRTETDNLKDERAVASLIAAAANHIPQVRLIAVEGLRKLRDPRSVARIVRLLGDPDRGVRIYVEDVLADFGPMAAPQLLLLDEVADHPRQRDAIERVIAKIALQDARAVAEVLRDQRADKTATVCECLAKWLGPQSIGVLQQLVKDAYKPTRYASVTALATVLQANGLTSPERESVVLSLVERVGDEAGDIRAWALKALGNVEDVRARLALVRALFDPESEVREVAAGCVRLNYRLGLDRTNLDVETFNQLLILARKEDDSEVVNAAAKVLGEVVDAQLLKAIVEQIMQSSGESGRDVKHLLARIARHLPHGILHHADESIKDTLVRAVGNQDVGVRTIAADLIARTGDWKLLPALYAASLSNTEDVQQHVDEAIRRLQIVKSETARNCLQCHALLSRYNLDDYCAPCLENQGYRIKVPESEGRPGYLVESRKMYRRRSGH